MLLQLSLRARMRQELCERGISASFGFAAIAALIFIEPFSTGSNTIRFFAAVIVLLNLYRFRISKAASRAKPISARKYKRLERSIVLNASIWAAIFAMNSVYCITNQVTSFFPFALQVAFSITSLISLSSSRFLSQYFAISNFGSQLLILTWLRYGLGYPVLLSMIYVYPIFLVYLLREAKELRKKTVERHANQMRLEKTNQKLLKSRQDLVEQTSRTVHSSRLASLGEMAGGVAHEINNPLSIITLSLESFEMNMEDESGNIPPKANEAIQRCHSAVNRISTIVRGLRNFSRAGDQDPMLASTAGQVIQDALDLCREKLVAHGVDLTVEGALDTPIECRPVEIAQILVNLISNSYDVVAPLANGERKIRISAAKESRFLCVRVSDSGPKLTRAAREKIFQPFYTSKPVGAGTGLGLSISRAIAKKHGGDLLLEDVPATTFILQLPLAI
jgi:signal transduction histidine kinase